MCFIPYPLWLKVRKPCKGSEVDLTKSFYSDKRGETYKALIDFTPLLSTS